MTRAHVTPPNGTRGAGGALAATVTVARDRFVLDVDVVAAAGEVTVVLGPNGAGKSTLLACIGGSLGVEGGRIAIGERVLDEPPATFVPPEHRRVGAVHQDHLLFPHLDVVDNVAFGIRCAGRRRRAARDEARQWLERYGVAELADRRPSEISGGQAQRVALARALAARPDALVLDEPLAALDAGTRVEVRRDLRHHLAGFDGPSILVTHDPLDALVLGARVVVLEDGRVVQAGTVAEVTARPRSRHVADLIGTNLLAGEADGAALAVAGPDGYVLTTAERHRGPVFATVAPAAVALHRTRPEGSARNRWSAVVGHLDVLGDRVRVQLRGPVPLVAEVTPAAVAELGLVDGRDVWVSVKATEIDVYPR